MPGRNRPIYFKIRADRLKIHAYQVHMNLTRIERLRPIFLPTPNQIPGSAPVSTTIISWNDQTKEIMKFTA